MAAVVSPGTTAHATIFDTAKPPPPPEVFAARHDAAALAAAADADAVSAFRDLGFGTLRRHIDAEGVTAAVAELGILAAGEAERAVQYHAAVDAQRAAAARGEFAVANGGDREALQYEAFARTWTAEQRKELAAVRKLQGFVRHSPALEALARREDVLALVCELMGGGVKPDDLVVHQSLALLKPPAPQGGGEGEAGGNGGREKPYHQDLAYFNLAPGEPLVGLWLALDDVDARNGCMHFLPRRQGAEMRHGMHRDWQIDDCGVAAAAPKGEPGASVPLPLSAGDALVFSGLAPHGTPPNSEPAGGRTRRAVQFHYSRRGAKTTTDEERLSRFASAES